MLYSSIYQMTILTQTTVFDPIKKIENCRLQRIICLIISYHTECISMCVLKQKTRISP